MGSPRRTSTEIWSRSLKGLTLLFPDFVVPPMGMNFLRLFVKNKLKHFRESQASLSKDEAFQNCCLFFNKEFL